MRAAGANAARTASDHGGDHNQGHQGGGGEVDALALVTLLEALAGAVNLEAPGRGISLNRAKCYASGGIRCLACCGA